MSYPLRFPNMEPLLEEFRSSGDSTFEQACLTSLQLCLGLLSVAKFSGLDSLACDGVGITVRVLNLIEWTAARNRLPCPKTPQQGQ